MTSWCLTMVLAIIVVLFLAQQASADCVARGLHAFHPYDDPDGKEVEIILKHFGPAVPLEGAANLATLKKLCPQYAHGRALTCCDGKQLESMDRYLTSKTAALALEKLKCPQCYDNSIRLFCAIYCDPDQSTFVRINNYTEVAHTTGVYLVNNISVTLNKKFYNTAFCTGDGHSPDKIGDGARNSSFLDLSTQYVGHRERPLKVNFETDDSDKCVSLCDCSFIQEMPVAPAASPTDGIGFWGFWAIVAAVVCAVLVVISAISVFAVVWYRRKYGEKQGDVESPNITLESPNITLESPNITPESSNKMAKCPTCNTFSGPQPVAVDQGTDETPRDCCTCID